MSDKYLLSNSSYLLLFIIIGYILRLYLVGLKITEQFKGAFLHFGLLVELFLWFSN